jgi:hypothetical protein
MGRKDSQGLVEIRAAGHRRLRDAEAILKSDTPLWQAHCAKYLAGYAVECQLKAVAMEKYGCRTLDELRIKRSISEDGIFTHGLEKLAKAVPSLYNHLRKSEIWRTFAHVCTWSPAWRYKPGEVTPREREAALIFLEEVKAVRRWLENNRY